MSYRLRRVQKAKPLKKIKETDAIPSTKLRTGFDNLDTVNRASDNREDSLRISIDTKAKVDLCDSSRGGTSRCQKAVQADDHDLGDKSKLVPLGIFLVINLDNGPHNSSHRTQFMKRLTEFADKHDLEIVLTYYPPYHSKYNPIERCWGILENHWNGTLLNTLETTLEWAKTMTWKGLEPVVEVLETFYKKGVSIGKKAFQSIADRITRHLLLPKYYVTIQPQDG